MKKETVILPEEMTIGDRIRSRRRQLKLTQKDLAKELGFSESYIGKIERGQREMGADTYMKVADALSIGMDELRYYYRW